MSDILSNEASIAWSLALTMKKQIVFRYKEWGDNEARMTATMDKFTFGQHEGVIGWLILDTTGKLYAVPHFVAGSIREVSIDDV